MNEYDEECLQVFLEKQLQLFQEEVATTPEEAEEFLSDCMATLQPFSLMLKAPVKEPALL